jgi:membrane-bound ClpP family serine protease
LVIDRINAIHSNVYGLILIVIGAVLVCLNQHDTGNSLIVGGGVLMNITFSKGQA